MSGRGFRCSLPDPSARAGEAWDLGPSPEEEEGGCKDTRRMFRKFQYSGVYIYICVYMHICMCVYVWVFKNYLRVHSGSSKQVVNGFCDKIG